MRVKYIRYRRFFARHSIARSTASEQDLLSLLSLYWSGGDFHFRLFRGCFRLKEGIKVEVRNSR